MVHHLSAGFFEPVDRLFPSLLSQSECVGLLAWRFDRNPAVFWLYPGPRAVPLVHGQALWHRDPRDYVVRLRRHGANL